ncbi:MAG: hypothetical protein HQK57_14070 [Deltaproteobacteria bacterium]|nr:hypothetical protein [Deltaproteobacteria bacterium]MBF0525572.1 hypothetical protein [Deltaproteobacteria bacterium]
MNKINRKNKAIRKKKQQLGQHGLKKRTIFLIAVRLISAYLMLLLFFRLLGVYYVKALAPLFGSVIELIKPGYRIVGFNLAEIRGALAIQFTTIAQGVMILADGSPYKGTPIVAGLWASILYVQPIIAFTILLAAPDISVRDRLKASALLIALIISAGLMDFPFIFIGIFDSHFHLPGSLFQQGLSFWAYFLDKGGRNFIALLLAIIAILPFRGRKVSPRSASKKP